MRLDLITGWIKVLFVFPLFLLVVLQLFLSPTCAQSGWKSDNATQNSTETGSSVFSYSSVFARYRGYQDESVTSWPEANAIVGQIGGWRFYAKEAAQLDQSEQKPVIPQQSPAPPLLEKPSKHMRHKGKP